MGFELLMPPFLFQKIWYANIYIFYKFLWHSVESHAIATSPLLYVIMKHIVKIIELNEYLNIFTV